MTIQQLNYIIALDTYRHYVTASEHCNVTQPTITTQVKKLEQEIGITIFDRNTHPLTPTEMGGKIIERARAIIRQVDQLKTFVNDERDELIGTFNIAVIPTIAPYIIPQFMSSFAEQHPETTLNIEELQSDEIIKRLHSGKIDAGVLVTPLEETSLREIPLYHEAFFFFAQPHHPMQKFNEVSVERIEGLSDLWLLSSGHCFRNQVINICSPQQQLKQLNLKSGSIETLKQVIQNNGGFTLVPELSILPNEKKWVVPFSSPAPVREVSLVTHIGFPKEALLTAIRREILRHIPKHFIQNDRYIKVKWR